jgi:CubicO group peptidase (beta-lactamase class C family)
LLNVLLAALLISGGTDGVPSKSPKSVGMSAVRLSAIDRVIQRGLKAGGYPGAAVVVGRRGAAVWEKGFGKLDWVHPEAVSPESTLYDIASLTKVVGTTTALMVLFDEGKLSLDDHVTKYLPAFTGDWKDSVTLRQLLEHRSGLPAGRDIWRVAYDPQTARDVVLESSLVCKPGDCYIYSDLGADLLGMTVEAISGQPLDVFLQERVFAPLGMTSTMFRPADSLKTRIAPTELTPPRGYPLRGEVHDENAYALGGVAGHAGLFSSAKDLAVFAQMMLNRGEWNGVRILSDSAVEIFTRRADVGSRALGWDTCDGNGGCGSYFGSRAYGHTGFTGTSLWIDPDREMFVILLTNRVHAAKARRPAQVISDVRADLADAAALAVVEGPYGMASMPSAFRADRAVGWNKPIRKSRSSRYARRVRSSRSSVSGRKTAAKSSAKKAKLAASKTQSGVSMAKTTKAASKPAVKSTRTSSKSLAAAGNQPRSTRR